MTQVEFRIDKKFKNALPELNAEEYAALEQLITRDGRCYDPLKVWAGKGILLDGHNRYEICTKHNIPYEVEELEFDSQAEAYQWVIRYHLGRRNLTPEQVSYYRGRRYNEEKGDSEDNLKQNSPRGQNGPSVNGRTSERLAEEEKSSPRTVKRDAQFACAIDTLSEQLGEDTKLKILSRESPVKKTQAKRLAEIASEAPDLAEAVVGGDLKFADANALVKLTKTQRKDAERMVREEKCKSLADAAKEVEHGRDGSYDVMKDLEKFQKLRDKLYANWVRPADKAAVRQFFQQMAKEV